MAVSARISDRERKVLAALAECGEDFGYLSFATIARRSGIEPDNVRRVTRSLARKGLAAFGKGLWTDDGRPAGSGYCATQAGRAVISEGVSA